MVAGSLAGRSSVDAPSGGGIWESNCVFRTSVEPRERPVPERDAGQLLVGSGCLLADSMAVAAGGPVFGRVADGTTSPADFLLLGRYYVGARSAYGVSCRRPFAGGRPASGGTYCGTRHVRTVCAGSAYGSFGDSCRELERRGGGPLILVFATGRAGHACL